MALTHEDIEELRKVFDREYVRITECNDIQDKNNTKFANDDKRIDRIMYLQEDANKKLTKNNWLTTAVLSVIIGAVITAILKANGVF